MSAQEPAVTVIVPMYNVQDYIVECLSSVQGQTFGDFEVICVDDGSTDATLSRAQERFADDGRFVFLRKGNGGQSSARNMALERARGTYLMFLDADDYYLAHTIETLIRIAERDSLDYLDFTAHPFYETERAHQLNDEAYYEQRPLIEGIMTGPELFVRYINEPGEYVCSPCLHFFKRSLLQDSGLRFKEGIVHEDELFSPQLISLAKRAAYLDEALYQRRMREGSTMTSRNWVNSAWCTLVASKSLERWLRRNCGDFEAAFIDALACRVNFLDDLAVEYALRATDEDLAAFAAGLSGGDLADFDLVIARGVRKDRERRGQASLARRVFRKARAAVFSLRADEAGVGV